MPRQSNIQDMFDFFAAMVPILPCPECLNVCGAGPYELEVADQCCPIAQVESEVTCLVGPSRPNVIGAIQDIEHECLVVFKELFLPRRFAQAECPDAHVSGANQWMHVGIRFLNLRQVFQNFRPFQAPCDFARGDDALPKLAFQWGIGGALVFLQQGLSKGIHVVQRRELFRHKLLQVHMLVEFHPQLHVHRAPLVQGEHGILHLPELAGVQVELIGVFVGLNELLNPLFGLFGGPF